jgi:hypothetical protein
MAIFQLTEQQAQRARYWIPPLMAGGIAWVTFLVLGSTPVIRASGLALVIVGMGAILRPMTAPLTVVGALALAFSPAFWAQTGGAERLNPLSVFLALAGAGALGASTLYFSKKPFFGVILAVIVFGGLFLFAGVGTPRSLRLTTLIAAWTLFLLVDGLFLSNPRPDSPPTGKLGARHTYGLLALLLIGVLNDPLVTLLSPAVILGLFLTNQRLPVWYWAVLIAISAYGAYGIAVTYAQSDWWTVPSELAKSQGVVVPYFIADGFRDSSRWLDVIVLLANQFTWVGVALGIIGGDAAVLLLPMLMIQTLWMTYAVYTFSQWVAKSLHVPPSALRLLAPAIFTLLPAYLLIQIIMQA